MAKPEPALGRCCCCGGKGARNIVMLDHQGSVPGTGWGCVQCGLPMNGASYVACDACIEADRKPREAIAGYPNDCKRESIEKVYARPRHEHDMTKHPESQVDFDPLEDAT